MNDSQVTIEQLKKEVNKFIQDREWQQFHSAKNLSISIICEAAELLEKFQWIELADSAKVVEQKRVEIEQELSDIVIVTLAFCNKYNIDLSSAIVRKLALNNEKYPIAKSKGRFTKYTDLDK